MLAIEGKKKTLRLIEYAKLHQESECTVLRSMRKYIRVVSLSLFLSLFIIIYDHM